MELVARKSVPSVISLVAKDISKDVWNVSNWFALDIVPMSVIIVVSVFVLIVPMITKQNVAS